jgi:hypothetical protein
MITTLRLRAEEDDMIVVLCGCGWGGEGSRLELFFCRRGYYTVRDCTVSDNVWKVYGRQCAVEVDIGEIAKVVVGGVKH